MLRDVTRYTAQVLMPPGWDERYITVFNSSFDEVGVEGVTSMTTKLRSAGLPVESLPGPPLLPPGLTPLGALPARARARQGGRARRRARAPQARPGDRGAPVRHRPPQVNPEHGLARRATFQWEFTDPDVPTWHLTVDNGSSIVAEGEAPIARPAPAHLLPGLGGHRRPAAGPAPRAGDRHACARAATRLRSHV